MLIPWPYYITFYFFLLNYFLVVVGLDSRSKQGADDGFVTVSLKPDKGTDVLFYMFTFLLVVHLFFGL